MLAVAVIAAERPVERLVARLDVAVGVLLIIWADDAAPAFVVDLRQHKVLLGQPLQHGVAASVADVDRPILGCIRLGRHDAQRVAYLLQRVFALGFELDQPRLEIAAPLLQVDAARHAAVAHGVCRARIGVARIGNRFNCGGEILL